MILKTSGKTYLILDGQYFACCCILKLPNIYENKSFFLIFHHFTTCGVAAGVV